MEDPPKKLENTLLDASEQGSEWERSDKQELDKATLYGRITHAMVPETRIRAPCYLCSGFAVRLGLKSEHRNILPEMIR